MPRCTRRLPGVASLYADLRDLPGRAPGDHARAPDGRGLEVTMEDREKRRDRTIRYGERARKIHLAWIHPNGVIDCVCERSAWKFAKGKSMGCRCRRVQRSLSPKIAGSLCHGETGYHPSVLQRIEGKRLARSWLVELRGAEADDVDL